MEGLHLACSQMSRRLAPITRRELVKRFWQLGWEGPRHGAKHDFMVKDRLKVRIPNAHTQDVGVGLLATMLRQAHISREEWFSAK